MPYKSKEDTNKFFRERYEKNQATIREYKISQGCKDCGWNEHHAGLEFDHIMPRLRGTVGAQMGKSMKVIWEEIARCEVVCSRCHSIRTWERNQ